MIKILLGVHCVITAIALVSCVLMVVGAISENDRLCDAMLWPVAGAGIYAAIGFAAFVTWAACSKREK